MIRNNLGDLREDLLPLRRPAEFVTVDFERTDPKVDSVCQIAVVRVSADGRMVSKSSLVRPTRVSDKNTRIHGITVKQQESAPNLRDIWPDFAPMFEGAEFIVAHGASSADRPMMSEFFSAMGVDPPILPWACTSAAARKIWPGLENHRLKTVAAHIGIVEFNHHHAESDALVCAKIAIAMNRQAQRAARSMFDDEPGWVSLPGTKDEPRRPRPASVVELRLHQQPVMAPRRLSLLADKISSCQICPLHTERKQTAFARGNPSASICFVGEAPGADEDAQGIPFVGRAGQLLDRMIVAMGLTPDEVYMTNVCKCRPPKNRTPTPDEMGACMPYLHEQIALVQPRVIVALGATATKGLLSSSLGIKAQRGTWKLYRGSIPVMPTYHPAYLLRQAEAGDRSAKREAWADLKAVMERLGRPVGKTGTTGEP